ncbi:hypothetical protein BaRGS_00036669, partial [Batillaria attramentaria]
MTIVLIFLCSCLSVLVSVLKYFAYNVLLSGSLLTDPFGCSPVLNKNGDDRADNGVDLSSVTLLTLVKARYELCSITLMILERSTCLALWVRDCPLVSCNVGLASGLITSLP